MLLERLLPPYPRLTVQRAVGVGVQGFESIEEMELFIANNYLKVQSPKSKLTLESQSIL